MNDTLFWVRGLGIAIASTIAISGSSTIATVKQNITPLSGAEPNGVTCLCVFQGTVQYCPCPN